MAVEAPLIPSQVRQDGQRWPVRHKTSPNLRQQPPPPGLPRRRSSLRQALRRKPLFTISEDKAPSLKSNSTVSLRLNIVEPYRPSSMSTFSEHLVYFCPSQQLQNYQSVSFHRVDEAGNSTSRLFRTQSQWRAPPSQCSYSDTDRSSTTTWTFDSNTTAPPLDYYEDTPSPHPTEEAEQDLPREAIADLFHRVEAYEREHPEVVRDAVGTVWVRVNSVGRELSTRIKKIGGRGRLRDKRDSPSSSSFSSSSFEPPRLGYSSVPQSRMRVYEKPSRAKRIKIAVGDSWRRFRNRATGRDTELWGTRWYVNNVVGSGECEYSHERRVGSLSDTTAPSMGSSGGARPVRPLQRRFSRGGQGHGMEGVRGGRSRRDSNNFYGGGEVQRKRRKSSLFLDVYPSDTSVVSPPQ